jgi:predicted SAM-dependent methyltransferase
MRAAYVRIDGQSEKGPGMASQGVDVLPALPGAGKVNAWNRLKRRMREDFPLSGHFISALEGVMEDVRRHGWRRSRTAQIEAWLRQTERNLVLGAGTAVLPGWLNADINPRVGRGLIFLDATEPFPLPDGCADIVFTEHMIEHIDYAQGAKMLRECLRVLKPGGALRVSTPDLTILLALCRPGRSPDQEWFVRYVAENMIADCPYVDPIFVINNEFRAYGHQFLYDEPTLTRALERAGFHDIVRYPMGESPNPALAGLEARTKKAIPGRYEMRAFETLALEARRPG